jgi:hypothetical protein
MLLVFFNFFAMTVGFIHGQSRFNVHATGEISAESNTPVSILHLKSH